MINWMLIDRKNLTKKNSANYLEKHSRNSCFPKLFQSGRRTLKTALWVSHMMDIQLFTRFVVSATRLLKESILTIVDMIRKSFKLFCWFKTSLVKRHVATVELNIQDPAYNYTEGLNYWTKDNVPCRLSGVFIIFIKK